MTSYLEGGWYSKAGRARLRTEVIDGAIDIAGTLLRSGVPIRLVLRVALKVRSLVVIADPLMHGSSQFGPSHRQRIAERLDVMTDGFPELQSFVADCVTHVSSASHMTAFYLHLIHITRMMQLLGHAIGPEIGAIIAQTAAPLAKKKTAKKKTAKKKTAKKKTAKKKAAKKK